MVRQYSPTFLGREERHLISLEFSIFVCSPVLGRRERGLIPREGRLTGAGVSCRYLVQEIDPTYTRVTTVDSLDRDWKRLSSFSFNRFVGDTQAYETGIL